MVSFQEARDWSRETFGQVDLGNARRTERLVRIATRAVEAPAGQVSSVFRQESERQAAYDFLESEHVSCDALINGLASATARASKEESFVFLPVDGSSVTLVDRVGDKGLGSIGRRELPTHGLKVITGLAVSDAGAPLGVATLEWWARASVRATRTRLWRGDETEMQYWRDAIARIELVFERNAPDVQRWYVLDREGDETSLFRQLAEARAHFTIRSKHDRLVQRANGRRAKLGAVVRRARHLGSYRIDVAAGPKRRARQALIDIRAERVMLLLPNYEHQDYPVPFEVTVLLARERRAPRGEQRLQWRLLTDHRVSCHADALRIVRSYCTRWRIEEFHKTWKSGACGVEETKLRARNHVIRWATVLAAVAARTERLKYLARTDPQQPASIELSAMEIKALIAAKRKQKNSVEQVPDGIPTIALAVRWIADIGGWGDQRYKKGAQPGSITIARGLDRLMVWTEALAAFTAEREQLKTRKKRDQS